MLLIDLILIVELTRRFREEPRGAVEDGDVLSASSHDGLRHVPAAL
jgi:hypothetical protein